MNHRESVLRYLELFCARKTEGMEQLFAPGLHFKGPLLETRSAAEYVEALQKDPGEPCIYEVVSLFEGPGEVCCFYDLIKPEGRVTLAQLFTFSEGKIAEILLVFDTGTFS